MILCKERKRPQVQGKMNCEVEKEKCLGSKLRRRKSSGKPVSCKLASTSALAAERNPPPCLFSGQNGNLNKEKTQLLRKSLNVDRKILCKMSSRLIWWICNWNYLHGLLCIYVYICKCYIWLYNLYSVFVFWRWRAERRARVVFHARGASMPHSLGQISNLLHSFAPIIQTIYWTMISAATKFTNHDFEWKHSHVYEATHGTQNLVKKLIAGKRWP